MAEKVNKRRKGVLTIDKKLETIKSIDAGASYTLIVEKYGIARSTIANIKKDALKVEAFKKKSMEMGFWKATPKTINNGEYEKLDKALYIWFRQQRELNDPVSVALLQEKASVLYERLYLSWRNEEIYGQYRFSMEVL